MARNHEKAQSMLHRFRAAQAAELGIQTGPQRRPRVASRVTNLRDAEKWRGDVLRDISRKVSKIQDYGLSDYEVRDLNDEINKLIREKSAWEYQIVALGGANYKRGVPKMLDDSGREVPGTRGYKYFGRAKDLPGVKELINRSAHDTAEMESFRSHRYRRFINQPPEYYGDADEEDGILLAAEAEAEDKAWREGYADVLNTLEEGADASDIPPIPRPPPTKLSTQLGVPAAAMQPTAAREGADAEANAQSGGADDQPVEAAAGDAASVSAMLNVIDSAQLQQPNVPDRARMEQFILEARKKVLREQCELHPKASNESASQHTVC